MQGFVNTLDVESGADALATPEALAGWLERHGLIDAGDVPSVGDAEHVRATQVREALRALLLTNAGEPLDPEAMAPLRAARAGEALGVEVVEDGGFRWAPMAEGVDGALGRLLAIAARASADGTWPRLKACRNHGCAWAFYDATKNRSGAWCSMEVCGSRMKARAYRRRRNQSA